MTSHRRALAGGPKKCHWQLPNSGKKRSTHPRGPQAGDCLWEAGTCYWGTLLWLMWNHGHGCRSEWPVLWRAWASLHCGPCPGLCLPVYWPKSENKTPGQILLLAKISETCPVGQEAHRHIWRMGAIHFLQATGPRKQVAWDMIRNFYGYH